MTSNANHHNDGARNRVSSHSDPLNAIDDGRRDVLQKLGKLVAYTPPAMLTLLLSQRASAQSAAAERN